MKQPRMIMARKAKIRQCVLLDKQDIELIRQSGVNFSEFTRSMVREQLPVYLHKRGGE